MTPIEAYSKICLVAKHEPVVMQCRNYEDFYGFYLAPPGSDPKTPTFVGLMCLVFKSSGEVIYEDDRPDIRVHRTPCEGIDPSIFTWRDLVDYVNDIGFLPLFSNELAGFSAEEKVSSLYWWTGDPERDPWIWREYIASSHQVAYGKFFGKRAGFISLEWLPFFANCRRSGYDFDARWDDGLASRREKKIMDLLTDQDEEGYYLWKTDQILSTELKKKAGFGKNGEKNYPGVITGLQMQTYLVIADFHRRVNKKGQEYGMPVSVYLPPEAIWGYDLVTSAYQEQPHDSWKKIYDRVQELFPGEDERSIVKVIGKKGYL